jgi:probable rRNA maturation factor
VSKNENFTIINKTNGKLPRLPFAHIKNHILGENYSLSLVIVSEKEIHKLNKEYRKVDSPTDILSFEVDKDLGEMFICLPKAKEKAVSFERTYNNFLSFLFIHGCVHLLGFDHGTKMEKLEEKYRKHFKV